MKLRHRFTTTIAAGFLATVVVTALPAVSVAPPEVGTTLNEELLTSARSRVRAGWTKDVSNKASTTDLVGVRWKGDSQALFAIEVRGKSGWEAVASVGRQDTGADLKTNEANRSATDEHVSEPVWVGDVRGLRIKLIEGSASAVDLVAVEAPPAVAGAAAGALSTSPHIISRAEWGADESLRLRNCPGGPTYMDAVRLAIVHHTADGNNSYSPSDSYRIVRAIYMYATNALGYCDIHYNFLVDKYGQVFEGRFGGVYSPVLGAHSIGFNGNTTGIALLGTYSDVSPPAVAIEALTKLIAWKLGLHGVDPTKPAIYTTGGNDRFAAGTTLALPIVIGHRDTWFTSCPGQAVWNLLPSIRYSAAARIFTAPPDAYPPWIPGSGPALLAMNEFGKLYPAGSQVDMATPAYWTGFPIGRGLALMPGGTGGYSLDGWGGLHRFGNAPIPTGSPYWPGWDIARDVELAPGGGGYVLDAWGGIHSFGGAPQLTGGPYFVGMDIARALVLLPDGTGAYVLDGWGGVHSVGSAPRATGGPYWIGRDWAVDLEISSDGVGMLLLDAFGGIWPIGGAAAPTAIPYFGFQFARSLATVSGTPGGYVLDRSGRIHGFGGAPAISQAQRNFVLALALEAS